MDFQDLVGWVALGLVPPRTDDPKEMRWRIVVSAFTGGIFAVVVIVGVIFFGRFNFVQLDVAHASDLMGQQRALEEVNNSVNQLKVDSTDFRKGQIETQLGRSELKVCKLIQALKLAGSSPLLGDALTTQQYVFNQLKGEYAKLGGIYREEPCDVVLLSGN